MGGVCVETGTIPSKTFREAVCVLSAAPGSGARPTAEQLLGRVSDVVRREIEVQLFQIFLESFAGEHGARMTAMDSATENASEMIASLTLTFNRARQAAITKELIEVVSGADALQG